MKSMLDQLAGKRVLVTGGTGFIGGHLVERLISECNARVRVLVRSFDRACQIARYPIEMVHGDVCQPADVDQAVKGCEIVFHCAYGNSGTLDEQRSINVEGTKNVLAAALRTGVKRLVHLSTIMTYGATPDGNLDETSPRRYLGDVYADSKLDAEKLVFECGEKHGLPFTVLQPTAVYGPYSAAWTINVLEWIKKGRVILVNGGDGLANVVYIDDLVDAILSAAVRQEALGEAFIISGNQPVTWRDLYGSYEQMMGVSGTVSMSAVEANTYYTQNRPRRKSLFKETMNILREELLVRNRLVKTSEGALLRSFAQYCLPDDVKRSLKNRIQGNGRNGHAGALAKTEKPIFLMSPALISFFATKTHARIDKARRLLGYEPAFTFESGMQVTEQWARWANLLNV